MSSSWNRVNLAIRAALDDVSLESLTDPAQIFPPVTMPAATTDL
jgi:hypothetical protein